MVPFSKNQDFVGPLLPISDRIQAAATAPLPEFFGIDSRRFEAASADPDGGAASCLWVQHVFDH